MLKRYVVDVETFSVQVQVFSTTVLRLPSSIYLADLFGSKFIQSVVSNSFQDFQETRPSFLFSSVRYKNKGREIYTSDYFF